MGGEARGRTALADQFRAAGGLRSSQYGKAIPRLEGEFQQQRGNLISDLTSRTLSPLIQGLLTQQGQQFMPADALSRLLAAVRPDISFDRSGGGGGGAGGGGPSPSMANNPFFSPEGGAGGAGGAGGGGVGGYGGGGGGTGRMGPGGWDFTPRYPDGTPIGPGGAYQPPEIPFDWNSFAGAGLGGGARLGGGVPGYGGGGDGGGGPGDMMFGMTPEEWGSPWGSLSPELNQQNQPSMLFDPTGMGVGGGDVTMPYNQGQSWETISEPGWY